MATKPKIKVKLTDHNFEKMKNKKNKYIVIHYTGDVGATAQNELDYFHSAGSKKAQASANYFVDTDIIGESVKPENKAWHCGGGLQDYGHSNGGATLHGICMNSNSIGIELCCYKKNGKIVPTPTAIRTAIPLVRWLMKKYNIPSTHVVRHFDVTGKCCPNGYIDHDRWIRLRTKLTGKAPKKSPVYPTVNLAKGDTGSQVKRLQKCLNKIMRVGLTVDGSFGEGTLKAVKAFQKKYKLTVDGSVGPKTRAKIKAAVTEKKTPVYPTKDLIKGDTGAQVLRLQKCLNKIMNAKLTLDSSFGNATFKAVKIFQKKYKLTVDGSVGPATRAKIKTLMA